MFKFLGAIFIAQPYLALLVGLFFGAAYFVLRNKVIGFTSLLWGLYGFYEILNVMRITCSGECNIRIDLLLIYPVLVLLSVISVLVGLLKVFRRAGSS